MSRFSSTSCRTRSARCSRCRSANCLRAAASRARMSACCRDLMATRLRARSISHMVWISSASSASISSSVGVDGRSAVDSAFTSVAEGAASESESSAALGGGVAARAGAAVRVRAREREREEGMGARSSAGVGAAMGAGAAAAMGKRTGGGGGGGGGGGAPRVMERACDGWKAESISALRASSVRARGAGGGSRLDIVSECGEGQRAEGGEVRAAAR